MPPRLLIRDATAVRPGGLTRANILCEGERILAIGRDVESPGATVVDASGRIAGPGFIDVHVHGGGGHTFFSSEGDPVTGYAGWAPQNGVTAFLVSTCGSDVDSTAALLEALVPSLAAAAGAEPLGFHLEGPFLNAERRGAFPARYLRPPDQRELQALLAAGQGRIRQLTIAPELFGALSLVPILRDQGCLPAMGHTDCTAEEARAGFAAGIAHVTHLFNAMRPLHHREGGPITAALLEPGVTCELIADGVHVSPEVLRLAYGALGPQRTVVVTDNVDVARSGAASGAFASGLDTSGGVARRKDGTIVGSVATMDHQFRNVMRFLGVGPEIAFRLCSTNPARVAGVARRKGILAPGMDADIVLLDAGLSVVATICRGELAFQRAP